MIDARVKAVRLEESRRVDEMSAQVVNLNQELLQASQTQAKLIQSLATVRKEQRTLLARSQSTLGEWLFASNGTAEQMDESNDRQN